MDFFRAFYFFPGCIVAAIPTNETARRITAMLNDLGGQIIPAVGGPRNGSRYVIVRADSSDPVTYEDGHWGRQFYPATIILASSDFIYPPDIEEDYEEGYIGLPVLLTLLSADLAAVAPIEGNVYAGVLCGEVEGDRQNPGTSIEVAGRPRVVGPLIGAGDVSGPIYATDNHIARYDGASGKLIQDSAPWIDDAGTIKTGAEPFIGGLSGASFNANEIRVGDYDGISGARVGSFLDGGGLEIRARRFLGVDLVSLRADFQVYQGALFPFLRGGFGYVATTYTTFAQLGFGGNMFARVTEAFELSIINNAAGTPRYAVRVYDLGGGSTLYQGVTGTAPDGAVIKGGIVTTMGTGTFLTDPGDGVAGGTYP